MHPLEVLYIIIVKKKKATDQSTSKEINADKYLVNLSIALYTLFIELDKFISIRWSYRNDSEKILQH